MVHINLKGALTPEMIQKRASMELARSVGTSTVPSNFDPIDMDLDGSVDLSPAETAIMLAQAEADAAKDLSQLHPYRCWAFWRTTRWILAKKNKLQQGETLKEANKRCGSVLFKGRTEFSSRYADSHDEAAAKKHLEMMPTSPWETPDPEERNRIVVGHLIVAQVLKISRGSKRNPKIGVLGLRRLNDTTQIDPRIFPMPEDLMEFETGLVERYVKKSYCMTRTMAFKSLQLSLGLSGPEAEEAIKLVDAAAVKQNKTTRKERQAHMVGMIETMLAKAVKGMNHQQAAMWTRLLIKVQGLDATDTSDADDLRDLTLGAEEGMGMLDNTGETFGNNTNRRLLGDTNARDAEYREAAG